jgi:hypothetical protein
MLATLLMFCCAALSTDGPRTMNGAVTVDSKISTDAAASETAKSSKPDAPTPKVAAFSASEEAETGTGAGTSAAEPASSSAVSFANTPVRPASNEAYETPRKRAIWYGLMVAGHSGAAFDAWTTRRAISGGYGTESDPTQRPFVHSGAIYATTQVSPLLMDYVGRKMMRSRYPLLRRFWWIPQAGSASLSFGSAIHNYRVVPSN